MKMNLAFNTIHGLGRNIVCTILCTRKDGTSFDAASSITIPILDFVWFTHCELGFPWIRHPILAW